MPLDNPVLSSLLPVVLLILVGYLSGRFNVIRQEAVRDLSNLVFLVLIQALLFRTMCAVDVAKLDLRSLSIYFAVAGGLFFVLLVARGGTSRAAVLALSGIFSNTAMIGIPLIGLAYGKEALVLLFTLISLHALVLLTMTTVVLELCSAREQAHSTHTGRHILRTVGLAVRNAILHPVPMPILAGLLFAQTGWVLPEVVDRPLQLLANAFSPVALVLMGVTLAQTAIGQHLRSALVISGIKNLLHPLLMALVGYAAGLRGITLTVLVMAAAMPIGANVFLFAQRYQKAEELVTASVVASTVMALFTVTLVMYLLPLWVA
ncbi:MAG: AEC family transporter [Rhodoferax sp.]|nr:AEC family transporter [Rhodoferax sp.]